MDSVAETFAKLTARLNYPIFIVTTAVGERREGCVIGFATQTSVAPRPLPCLPVAREPHVPPRARGARELAVHLAPRDDDELVELFGGETGDEIDKFTRCEWREGPRAMPILAGCPSWFAGSILSRHDLGDHQGFLLEPIDGPLRAGRAVVLPGREGIEPGHDA